MGRYGPHIEKITHVRHIRCGGNALRNFQCERFLRAAVDKKISNISQIATIREVVISVLGHSSSESMDLLIYPSYRNPQVVQLGNRAAKTRLRPIVSSSDITTHSLNSRQCRRREVFHQYFSRPIVRD